MTLRMMAAYFCDARLIDTRTRSQQEFYDSLLFAYSARKTGDIAY